MLKGVYVHDDLLFLHVSLRNFSNIGFDIDFIRFKIADKQVTRRTAVQETFLKPVRIYNDVTTVGPKKEARTVYGFGKITIPDKKALVVEIYEKNGGRHLSFSVENSQIVNARSLDGLKIE